MIRSTDCMLVLPDIPPFGGDVYAGNVNVPSVDEVPLRQGIQYTSVDSVPIDDLHLGKPYSLLESRGRRDTRHHHQLYQFSTFCG